MSMFVKKLLGLLSFLGTIPWVLFCIGRIIFLIVRHGPSKFFERKKHDPLPKAAQNPKFEHDFVRTKSGMKFHCVHAGPRKAKLMLCVHGFPECWYTYHHVLNDFSDEYHVVAFDMRGYGDSDKPQKISQYHRDYLANDVRELIHALGYEKAIIVAHNWGGIVTWYFAQVFPECVDRMIIMNCPHVAAFWDYTLAHPLQFLKFWYVFLFQCPYLPELMMSALDYIMVPRTYSQAPHGIRNADRQLTPEEMGIFKYSAGKNFTYACNYYRAANPLYNGLRLKKKNEIIKQPTLVVWGMEDHILGTAYLPYLSGAVENLIVKKIEGCSHWVALDRPDVLAVEMRKFLKTQAE